MADRAADDLTHVPKVCTDVLRVVGVRNDVLWLRSFPGIPETGGASNVLLGIPPDAVEVRDLGQTEGAWRRVSFRGVTGFASLRHLKQHMRYCTVRPQQPAPSASPGRLSSA